MASSSNLPPSDHLLNDTISRRDDSSRSFEAMESKTANNSHNKRLRQIKQIDQLALDLRLTLFASTLYSLKSISLLKPYPVAYFDESSGEIDVPKLKNVLDNITSLRTIDPNSAAFDLVHWIATFGSIELRSIAREQIFADSSVEFLKQNLIGTNSAHIPRHIFRVSRKNGSAENWRAGKAQTFARLKAEFGSFYAFHGSALENFHSILHHGLAVSLNRRSLFGAGIYLSLRLSTAIEFSPFTLNFWPSGLLCGVAPIFGRKLSCVAVCEVANSPDGVKSSKDKQNGIPQTYIVVTNDDCVRVAYLLIYSEENQISSKSLSSSTTSTKMISAQNPRDLRTDRNVKYRSIDSIWIILAVFVLFFAFGYLLTAKHSIPD